MTQQQEAIQSFGSISKPAGQGAGRATAETTNTTQLLDGQLADSRPQWTLPAIWPLLACLRRW
jgi:hypothetical protein